MDIINTTLLFTTILQNDTLITTGKAMETSSVKATRELDIQTTNVPTSDSYSLPTTMLEMIDSVSVAMTTVPVIPSEVTSTPRNTFELTSEMMKSNGSNIIVTLEMISAKEVLTYIPAIIFTIILMLIGIPGNAIAGYVYFKKWRRSSTRTFILTLAILDFVNCCLTLPFEIAVMSLPLRFDSGIACKILRFTTYFCNTSAALILIAIAVDRYHRICKPLEEHMTSKTSKIIVIVVMIVALFFMSPSLILYGTQTIPIKIGPQVLYGKACIIEDYFTGNRAIYPLAYFIFNCVATSIIFFILTLLYTFVGLQVCRRNRLRKLARSTRSLSEYSVEDEDDKLYIGDNAIVPAKSNPETDTLNGTLTRNGRNGKHKGDHDVPPSPGAIKLVFMSAAQRFRSKSQSTAVERRGIRIGRTTIMLIIVTVVYVISFLPFLGLSIHRSIHPNSWIGLSVAADTVYKLFFRTYLLNCAANPIIYSFCNELFRKECLAVLKQIFRHRS